MATLSQITMPNNTTHDILRNAFFGTCNTAAATADKVVTLSDAAGWSLKTGTIIGVKFTNSNSASSCTLNVNDSGAKSVWYDNAVYTGNDINICGSAGRTNYYIYDGTYWVWMNCGTMDSEGTTIEESEPYIFRQGNGYLADEKLFGGTVVWIQQRKGMTSSQTINGITLTQTNTGIDVTGTVETEFNYNQLRLTPINITIKRDGSKYLITVSADESLTNYYFGVSGYNRSTNGGSFMFTTTADTDWIGSIYIHAPLGTTINLHDVNINVFNLTKLFGSTIADYIYNLEQTTAGAGVAWFRNYFPNDYYAYDSGSLQSVCIESKKVTRKNLLDTSDITHSAYNIGNIPNTLKPNTTYTYSVNGNTTYKYRLYTAKSDAPLSALTPLVSTYISKSDEPLTFTTPSTMEDLLCIAGNMNGAGNESFDNILPQVEVGSNATAYEPYKLISYPYDSSKQLRGLFNLDSNNNLVCDGDVYESNGSITRKYGIVDLGSVEWTYVSSIAQDGTTYWTFRYSNNDIKRYTGDAVQKSIISSNRYKSAETGRNMWEQHEDKTYCLGTGYHYPTGSGLVFIDDSYTDATAFKTAMSGVYLLYELATLTTESADPYLNPSRSYPDGIEEFVDHLVTNGTRDVSIPVWHETTYYLNKVIESSADYIDAKYEELDNNIDTKQDILTEGDGIDISEENVISVEESYVTEISTDTIADLKTTKNAIITNGVAEFECLEDNYVKSLTADIDPIQDLHGYDNPWVGGAGKNKLPLILADIKALNTSGIWSGNAYTLNDVTFSVNTDNDGNVIGIKVNGTASSATDFNIVNASSIDATQFNNYILNGCTGGSSNTYYLRISDTQIGAKDCTNGDITITNLTNTGRLRVYIHLANGLTVSNLMFYPMIRLSTESDPTFEPYSNICPISGHTEVDLYNVGKNKLDPNSTIYNAYIDGITGIITSSDTDRTIVMKVNPSSNYVFTWNRNTISSTDNCRVSCYSELPIVGTTSGNLKGALTESGSLTFNTNSNESWIAIKIGTTTKTDVSKTIIASMLELGSTATSYEPYQGKLYQVQIGSTVYGGTFKAVEGEPISIDSNFQFYELNGSETWYSGASNAYGQIYYLDASPRYVNTINELCSWLKRSNNNSVNTPNGTITGYSTGGSAIYLYFFVRFDFCADLNAWKTFLSNKPLQVAYRVADSYANRIILAKHLFKTFLGENNVSASTGDITELKYTELLTSLDYESSQAYKVDISALGTNESGRTTASRAYTTGEFFYKDGKMYKVLTSIASGATFTVGTNISETTLFAELTALA